MFGRKKKEIESLKNKITYLEKSRTAEEVRQDRIDKEAAEKKWQLFLWDSEDNKIVKKYWKFYTNVDKATLMHYGESLLRERPEYHCHYEALFPIEGTDKWELREVVSFSVEEQEDK